MAALKKKAKSVDLEGGLMTLDILIEVLVRLPVKFLIRMKSVCKYWNSVISSREFANVYQKHATSIPSLNLIFIDCMFTEKGVAHKLYTFKIESCDVNEVYRSKYWIHHMSKSPQTLDHKLEDTEILPIGTCNGLICYIAGSGHTTLHLWNPATHEYSYIKGPRLSKHSDPLYWGFGYDPLADDYKIILLGIELRKPFARIYRLRTGRWTRVECPSAQELRDFIIVNKKTTKEIELGSLAVLVGQTLYWRVKHSDNLLAFDLARESFEILCLPGQTQDPRTSKYHICEDFFICQLRQSLCACWVWNECHNNDPTDPRLYITVWMLEGNGIWKLLFKYRGLERCYSRQRLLSKLFELKEHGKYLIPDYGFDHFFVVDPRGERHHPSKNVRLPSTFRCPRYVFEYIESLASPTHHQRSCKRLKLNKLITHQLIQD